MIHKKLFIFLICLLLFSGAALWGSTSTMAALLYQDTEILRSPPSVQDTPGHEVSPVSQKLIEALKMVNRGSYDTAIILVEEVLRDHPDSAQAYEILGAAFALKGETEKGIAALKKTVELDPGQSSAYTKLGDVYMARQEFTPAKEAFLAAVAITPNDRRAHQRLGLLYEMEGQNDLAIDHFEKGVIGTPPGYVGVKVNLGRLYNLTRQFDRTAGLLGTLITSDNKNTLAHIVLGTAYLALQETDAAVREFEIAKQLEPQSANTRLSLGIALREKGELRPSLKELDAVVGAKPDWSTGYFQRGETLLAMKEFDQAIKDFEKAAQLSDNPVFIKKRIGSAYLDAKQVDRAIAIYEEIRQANKADIAIYDLLGTAYQISGHLDLAEKTFQEMCSRFSQDALSYYKLGLFYGYVKKYDASITQLEKALTLSPESPVILKALSVAHAQKGDGVKAIATAQKLVAVGNHTNADDVFYLAALYQDTGQLEKAKESYEEVLSQKADNAFAANNLANIFLEEGNLEKAYKFASKAVEAMPENPMILDTYGWVVFKQNDLNSALISLEKSAKLLPDNPVILYHLGAVQYSLGNKEDATKTIEKAFLISKNFKGSEEARKILDQ